MNDRQFSEKFVDKFNVAPSKIHILPAFIAPTESERIGLPKYVLDFKAKHDFILSANASKLIKENGFDVYGVDMLVELVIKLRKDRIKVGLIFLLPMIGDEVYYDEIKQRIINSGITEDFIFIEGKCENGFEYWEMSDVFIRPTYTDMEGISIKEALSLGTMVVASDVCVRPVQCILFKNRDFEDLYDKISDLYESKKYKVKKKYISDVDVAKATWDIYRSLD